MNAITEANSIEQVVEIINAANNDSASDYFGGSDTRESYEMAGQYAFEAAIESGYDDEDSIKGHLGFLMDAGAEFDFNAAVNAAMARA